jgi:hypothetical protein
MNSNLEKLGFWITIIATISLSMILLGMTRSALVYLTLMWITTKFLTRLSDGFIGLITGI